MAFIRPHLDYGDIAYDKPNNETFINKIEKAQYDAALAITGTIRGTSLEKLYAELGIESLKFRRWFRKLACFYKIQSTGLPKYLLQLIPTNNHSYTLRKLRKGVLLGLRQFLATGSRLKMMKNVFYFTSKPLSVFKIFKFLP